MNRAETGGFRALGGALLGVLCVRNDCVFIKTNLEPQNALVPGAVGAVERPRTR